MIYYFHDKIYVWPWMKAKVNIINTRCASCLRYSPRAKFDYEDINSVRGIACEGGAHTDTASSMLTFFKDLKKQKNFTKLWKHKEQIGRNDSHGSKHKKTNRIVTCFKQAPVLSALTFDKRQYSFWTQKCVKACVRWGCILCEFWRARRPSVKKKKKKKKKCNNESMNSKALGEKWQCVTAMIRLCTCTKVDIDCLQPKGYVNRVRRLFLFKRVGRGGGGGDHD